MNTGPKAMTRFPNSIIVRALQREWLMLPIAKLMRWIMAIPTKTRR